MSSILDNIPTDIEFGFCAVGETTNKTFYLTNPNPEPKKYSIEFPAAFSFTPKEGTLLIKKSYSLNKKKKLWSASIQLRPDAL